MNNQITPQSIDLTCGDCGSHSLFIHKKGFSGKEAILSFVVSLVTMLIICAFVLSLETQNDILLNQILFSLTGLVPVLSLFAGTIKMNDIYVSCLSCGNTGKPDK